jgi:hypothetical protein
MALRSRKPEPAGGTLSIVDIRVPEHPGDAGQAYFAAGDSRRAIHFEEEALKREPGKGFFLQQSARFRAL